MARRPNVSLGSFWFCPKTPFLCLFALFLWQKHTLNVFKHVNFGPWICQKKIWPAIRFEMCTPALTREIPKLLNLKIIWTLVRGESNIEPPLGSKQLNVSIKFWQIDLQFYLPFELPWIYIREQFILLKLKCFKTNFFYSLGRI